MARIHSAQLCELAFLDNSNRLCLIGLTTRLPVPSLPIAVWRLMIAAHVIDVCHGDELNVTVSLVTPAGVETAPRQSSIDIAVAGDYMLITLRDLPLRHEGKHQLLVAIDGGSPTALDVVVLQASRPAPAEIH